MATKKAPATFAKGFCKGSSFGSVLANKFQARVVSVAADHLELKLIRLISVAIQRHFAGHHALVFRR